MLFRVTGISILACEETFNSRLQPWLSLKKQLLWLLFVAVFLKQPWTDHSCAVGTTWPETAEPALEQDRLAAKYWY